MGLLSKSAILGQAANLRTEDVQVPGWEGLVRIRELTGAERDRWEGSLLGNNGKIQIKNIRASLVAMSVVGDDGKRVFTDAEAAALGELPGSALDVLFDAAKRLSKLDARDLKEVEGKSEADLSDDSGTA